MMDAQHGDKPEIAAEGLVAPLRRRLFKGAAGGTGVLLAVHSRTALGQVACQSPSAAMSGNTSPLPGAGNTTCVGGRSPGYWKVPQSFTRWTSIGAVPPTFKTEVVECSTGISVTKQDLKTPGTLLSSIFTTSPVPMPAGALASKGCGLWEVLAWPTNYAPNGQLLRHLGAAWLNAAAYPGYPITRSQVTAMWNQLMSTGVYCPMGAGNCGTRTWSPAEVIAYISGMYDQNLTSETNLCKKT